MAEKDLKIWIQCAEKAGYRVVPLAKMLGLSRRQLERYTRRCFNESPRPWLDGLRLKKAAELLKRNRIKEVSLTLGFKQFSHFSKKFKLYYGLPPKDFVLRLEREQTSTRS